MEQLLSPKHSVLHWMGTAREMLGENPSRNILSHIYRHVFLCWKVCCAFLGSGSKAFFFFFFPQQKNTVPPFPVRYQILDIRYKNDAKDQRSLKKLIQR